MSAIAKLPRCDTQKARAGCKLEVRTPSMLSAKKERWQTTDWPTDRPTDQSYVIIRAPTPVTETTGGDLRLN